jgi:hypothetical protein
LWRVVLCEPANLKYAEAKSGPRPCSYDRQSRLILASTSACISLLLFILSWHIAIKGRPESTQGPVGEVSTNLLFISQPPNAEEADLVNSIIGNTDNEYSNDRSSRGSQALGMSSRSSYSASQTGQPARGGHWRWDSEYQDYVLERGWSSHGVRGGSLTGLTCFNCT